MGAPLGYIVWWFEGKDGLRAILGSGHADLVRVVRYFILIIGVRTGKFVLQLCIL